jgi:dipeptidase D
MMLAPALAAAVLAATPGAQLRATYQARYADRLVPLLSEVVRYDTVEDHAGAFAEQRAWLTGAATALGLEVKDQGSFVEVELPGPAGAPVLGLIVHGDVQPADPREWTVPPFSGEVRSGEVWGRGAADDKGPLVQALLAMATLRASGLPRTSTVRLLVGTAEEGKATDAVAYLEKHEPPAFGLVLDSDFPVVVGEKLWHEILVSTPAKRPGAPAAGAFEVTGLEAGLATSIVPDRAVLTLAWMQGAPNWEPFLSRVRARTLPAGTRLEVSGEGARRVLTVLGKSAHSGMTLRQGRNALVALAIAVDGLLPPCGAADLLAFALQAGRDLEGTGLGFRPEAPPWNGFDTNVATVKPEPAGQLTLAINVRSPPTLWGAALKEHVEGQVRAFDQRTGAALAVSGGFYEDKPLAFDPQGRLVQRLLAAYARAMGKPAQPVVSGGGTYAKRFPRTIAFGMWFHDKPYPGHAADERISVADLEAGMRILLEALGDLVCGRPLERPFER